MACGQGSIFLFARIDRAVVNIPTLRKRAGLNMQPEDSAHRILASQIQSGEPGTDFGGRYLFTVKYLCVNLNRVTKSLYFIQGSRGSFNEDVCGRGDSGRLRLAADAVALESPYGPVTGFICNASGMDEKFSIFFSDHPVAYGGYAVCKGTP